MKKTPLEMVIEAFKPQLELGNLILKINRKFRDMDKVNWDEIKEQADQILSKLRTAADLIREAKKDSPETLKKIEKAERSSRGIHWENEELKKQLNYWIIEHGKLLETNRYQAKEIKMLLEVMPEYKNNIKSQIEVLKGGKG